MPFVKSKVEVRNYFPEVNRKIIADARDAVTIGARVGADVAHAAVGDRIKTGQMANILPTPTKQTVDGVGASFASRVFYAAFHEFGTLGGRRKPLKSPPRGDRDRSPGTGIEALGFMRAGRRAGKRAMLEHIRRTLPR